MLSEVSILMYFYICHHITLFIFLKLVNFLENQVLAVLKDICKENAKTKMLQKIKNCRKSML